MSNHSPTKCYFFPEWNRNIGPTIFVLGQTISGRSMNQSAAYELHRPAFKIGIQMRDPPKTAVINPLLPVEPMIETFSLFEYPVGIRNLNSGNISILINGKISGKAISGSINLYFFSVLISISGLRTSKSTTPVRQSGCDHHVGRAPGRVTQVCHQRLISFWWLKESDIFHSTPLVSSSNPFWSYARALNSNGFGPV